MWITASCLSTQRINQKLPSPLVLVLASLPVQLYAIWSRWGSQVPAAHGHSVLGVLPFVTTYLDDVQHAQHLKEVFSHL